MRLSTLEIGGQPHRATAAIHVGVGVNVVDSLILRLHTPTHTALTGPHIHCRWCKAQCGCIFLSQNIEGKPINRVHL